MFEHPVIQRQTGQNEYFFYLENPLSALNDTVMTLIKLKISSECLPSWEGSTQVSSGDCTSPR